MGASFVSPAELEALLGKPSYRAADNGPAVILREAGVTPEGQFNPAEDVWDVSYKSYGVMQARFEELVGWTPSSELDQDMFDRLTSASSMLDLQEIDSVEQAEQTAGTFAALVYLLELEDAALAPIVSDNKDYIQLNVAELLNKNHPIYGWDENLPTDREKVAQMPRFMRGYIFPEGRPE